MVNHQTDDDRRAAARRAAGLPPLDTDSVIAPKTPARARDQIDFSTMTPEQVGQLFAERSRGRAAQVPVSAPMNGKVAGALETIDFLSSGETFLRRISGGRIDIKDLDTPLPDILDKGLEEVIDLAANPLSVASIFAFPIAVPARLAVSPLGKLAFRAGGELAFGAAGAFAAGQVADRLPEDAPMPVQILAPLAAALVAGGGTAVATNRAVRSMNPKVILNLAHEEMKITASAHGREWVPALNELEDVIASFPAQGKIGRVAGYLGVDPVRLETTQAGLAWHAWKRQKGTSRNAAALAVTTAFPDGLNAFRFVDGAIDNANDAARGIQWNDAFAFKDADVRFGLNAEQSAQRNLYNQLSEEVLGMTMDAGVKRTLLDTKGEIYVPRQFRRGGKVVAGQYETPSNSALNRVHERASELKGNYLDPLETMALHLDVAYRQVADFQLDRALDAISVNIDDAFSALNGPLLRKQKRVITALGEAQNTETRLRTSIVKQRAKLTEARRSGTEARITKLQTELDAQLTLMKVETLPTLVAARKTAAELSKEVVSERAAFKRTKELPGSMFGRNDKSTPVAIWKKRFMPQEDVERLAKYFDTTSGGPLPPTGGKIIRTADDVGGALRTASATADYAVPLLQGFVLLATDPVAWSKMATKSYLAFFDPAVQGRYMRENFSWIQDMVINGRVPLGDVEVFTALTRGGAFPKLARQIERLPGGGAVTGAIGKTLGAVLSRFESSYNMALLVMRTEMWKARRGTFTGTPAELGGVIRNASGGMDTASQGVGQAQRASESLMLWSPKLMRSNMALIAKAFQPWTAEGAESAYILLRTASAATGLAVLANVAAGLAAGDTDLQMTQRVQMSLSPWEGKEFLSVEVNGQWFGIGGQIRSITQMLANTIVGATNKLGITEEKGRGLDLTSLSDNPLTAFLMGRPSPLAQDVAAGLELATGEKLNLLPFDTIDSVPKLAEVIGTSALPFVLQGALEEARDPASSPSLTLALSDFLGARSSVTTALEQRDSVAFDQHGLLYRELSGTQQDVINADNPELVEAIREFGDLNERENKVRLTEIDTETTGTLIRLEQKRMDGQITSLKDFREQIEDTLRARSIAARTVRNADDEEFPVTSMAGAVLSAYYDTFNLARIDHLNENSPLNFDILDQLQASLDRDVQTGVYGDPVAAQKIIDERRKFKLPAELQWYDDNKETIRTAGYWEVKDTIFEIYKERINMLPQYEDVNSFGQLMSRILFLSDSGATVDAFRGKSFQKLIDERTGNEHQRMRINNPILDKALLRNGYTTTRLTRD